MTTEQKFWNKVSKNANGCWLWTGILTRYGYGRLKSRLDRGIPNTHRYSWELANGPIPEGMEVCHNCPGGDNPACVNPAHLFLGTHHANMLDALAKGRLAPQRETFKRLWREEWSDRRGSNIHCSKLTESDVREIRRIYALGKSGYITIGKQFGVNSGSVRAIIKGRTWAHIK